jgi:hypothetical protein
MATYNTPKRGVAFKMYVGLVDQADTRLLKANPTIASGDFQISKDGGAFANLATLPSANPASSRAVMIDLSASEMTADNIVIQCVDASGAEWCDQIINLQTTASQLDDLATAANLATLAGYVDTEVAAIVTATTASAIRTALGLASANLDTQIGTLATAANLATAVGYIDTEVAAIKAKTDNLPAAPAAVGDIPSAATIADAVWDEALSGHATSGTTGAALSAASGGGSGGLDAAGVRAAIGLASANLDTQLAALPTAAENADAVWDEAVDGSTTARESMRLHNSALGGKASGMGSTTAVFRDLADSKARITATVDADGNRTAITRDLT